MSGQLPTDNAAQQIADDHRSLRASLEEVARALREPHAPGEAALLVRGLAEHLEQHFRREEEGGYFKDVACRAPQLARLAAGLELEHPLLLKRLRAIGGQLECEADPLGSRPRLVEEFAEFTQAIISHEQDEQQLIQQTFNDELGCSD